MLVRSACFHIRRRLCAVAGRHQTPVVDALWKKRAALKEAASPSAAMPGEQSLVSNRGDLSKPPQISSVTYALSSDAELADTYRNPWGNVRAGRLLEDLDALAGTIAYQHCYTPGEMDLLLVTASVDRIVYRHRPDLRDDLTLSGQVTWTGRSSMEIGMRAVSSWATEPFLEASFTFVARDPTTNRPASINPLQVAEGSDEAARFALGARRDAQRKQLRQQAKANVYGHSLSEETIAHAHDLLQQSESLLSMPALADEREILLAETRLQNSLIAQPQQRNTAGRVFGGFLMRRAFELAHATAYLFAGRRPVFLELDEVLFKAPVSVGDLLKLESCVLYTSESMDALGRCTIHVEVLAQVIQPEQRSSVTSNSFNFTFGISEHADGTGKAALAGSPGTPELRRVLPATHQEAYRVMERYQADLAQRAEDEAASAPPRELGD